MTSAELQSVISAGLTCDHIRVDGDGRQLEPESRRRVPVIELAQPVAQPRHGRALLQSVLVRFHLQCVASAAEDVQ